jgi:hypothetical protein
MTRLLPLVALLAACTPMEWVKDGADGAQARRDLVECGREAWLRSYDRTWSYGPPGPLVMLDAAGRPVVVNPYGPMSDPVVIEQRLTDFCMRGRGYRLTEVPKPPR